MSDCGQAWEYIYADFAIGYDGYFLLALNDAPASRSFSLAELSERLGQQNWELISSVQGRRIVPKNSVSLGDFLKGNIGDLVDVVMLTFKRPLTASRLQEQLDKANHRKVEAAQFLEYLRQGGVQLVATSPSQIQVRGGRLSSESQSKYDRLKPELLEILMEEATNK